MKSLQRIIATIALLFLVPLAQGQQNTYKLNPNATKKILKSHEKYPEVNYVSKESFSIKNTSKKKTSEYLILEQQLQQMQAENLELMTKCNAQLDAYNSINEIKVLIEKYYANTMPFDLKKKHLIAAQKIATAQHKTFLIYADTHINPNQNSKFLVLKSNPTDLKVHHRRIIWNIDKNNPEPPTLCQETHQKLTDLKTKIQGVKKYENSVTNKKKYTSKKLVMGTAVRDLESLSGTFKKLDNYYCMATNYGTVFKNQLLKKEELKSLQIPNNRITSQQAKCLFTNAKTGAIYIAASDFLDKFNFTENQTIAKQPKKTSQENKTAKLKSIVSYKTKKLYVAYPDKE